VSRQLWVVTIPLEMVTVENIDRLYSPVLQIQIWRQPDKSDRAELSYSEGSFVY